MTSLETLAREYANKLYPLGNDEHEGTFVTDEAYPEDYRLDVCGAFLAGAQARQPEIDELVAALRFYSTENTANLTEVSVRIGDPPYDGWQIIDKGQKAREALKKHGRGENK